MFKTITQALVVAVVLVGFAPSAFASTGATFTTDSGCSGVNVNIFATKGDVYLDGGPHHSGATGLPDGNYYGKVTTPSGDVLGKTTTNSIIVAGGEFAQCYKLADIMFTASSVFTTAGFDNTTNGGGEYKVWVSLDSGFAGGTNKTDNFKVNSAGGGGPQFGTLTGVKWEDLDADGVMDQDEQGLQDWTIEVYDATHTTLIDSATTDSNGMYLLGDLPAGTYQVCEVMPANWYPSYPTTSTPNCHTAVVITAGGTTTGVNFGNYQKATITVKKNVVAPDGTTDISDAHGFEVTVDGTAKPFAEGTDATYLVKPGSYAATETVDPKYDEIANDGPAVVTSGGTATITITNKQHYSHLIVIKHVDGPTSKTASNFTMTVTGNHPSQTSFAGAEAPGVDVTLWTGAYTADESATLGFIKTTSADCSGSLAVGETKTCTITNTVPPAWCSPGFWKNAIDKKRTAVLTWLTNAGVNLTTNTYSVIPGSLNPAPLKTGSAATIKLAQVLGAPNTYGGPAFNSVADYFAYKLGWNGSQTTAALYGEYCPIDANGNYHLF